MYLPLLNQQTISMFHRLILVQMTLTAMTMNPRECSRLEIRMENEAPKRGIVTDILRD